MANKRQKIARLVLIADELNEEQISDTLVSKIKTVFELWFQSKNTDTLLYDQSWGGIITHDGLREPGVDFGNAWYNDHHYHYGYLAYALSVVVKHDPGKCSRKCHPPLVQCVSQTVILSWQFLFRLGSGS